MQEEVGKPLTRHDYTLILESMLYGGGYLTISPGCFLLFCLFYHSDKYQTVKRGTKLVATSQVHFCWPEDKRHFQTHSFFCYPFIQIMKWQGLQRQALSLKSATIWLYEWKRIEEDVIY